jgi:hypothetical protein
VFAAAQANSFKEASRSLAELSELRLLSKRVWRAATRIGAERIEEARQAVTEFEALPLPARGQSPIEIPPEVVCVQTDGGRYQELARVAESAAASADRGATAEDKEGHWCEYKAGVLTTLSSQVHAQDPCPELPATFFDPEKMRTLAREIKGFTTESPATRTAEDQRETELKERAGRPQVLVKSVVATNGDVDTFGPQLAAAAYARGFFAAARKAFVGDGSETNWSVWRRYFSHFTPIVDFVHALMYVYAAAMAGRPSTEGWAEYRRWAQWLWEGRVDLLLAALEGKHQELGLPEPKETGTPRAEVTRSLTYLTNQRERMKYDQYRRQGLPITSSLIESTIKQINRRIKGTEKFWDGGGEAMLQLIADRLSPSEATDAFWSRRKSKLVESACYRQAA